MNFTGHHLLLLVAFLLQICCISAAQRKRSHSYHESWTPGNQKDFKNLIRGTISDNSHRGSMNSSHILDEIAPNLVPIDHFRKPFDQFKWPWKNYEDWKRHQKKIEDKIDRMLKPRNRRFPPNPRSKKTGSHKKEGNTKMSKSHSTPLRKKRNRKKKSEGHKKSPKMSFEAPLPLKLSTSTETATRMSIATPFPAEEFPTGGVVLAVKYYSTNDQ